MFRTKYTTNRHMQKHLKLLFLVYLFIYPFIIFGEVDNDETPWETSCPEKEVNQKPKEEAKANDKEKPKEETKKEAKEESKPGEKEEKENKESKPGEKEDEKEEPPKIGNFSLPTSQQPYGLFAFGGNIIDKGEVQIFLFADAFRGRKKIFSDVIPSVLWGVTDDFSVQLNFPFTPIMKDGCERSAGLEDFFVQLEYAFWNKSTTTYQDQATLVASVYAPTGSVNKNPPTGFGSTSLFVGATYLHMRVDWFVFANEGAILMTSNHRRKTGDQFLYQFGFGRNFPSPCGWIYAWMIEVDGQYFKKNEFHGHFDPNSGGNYVFVTPSLWMSSENFLVQFGVSFPIVQNLFGRQRKFDYALNFNIAWSFY
jgi:hypothetical protein